MSEMNEMLLALRDVGLRQVPERGDAGDLRVWATLERAMSREARRPAGWARRRIRIGGLTVTPAVLLATAATAVAATAIVIATDATTLFESNPQAIFRHSQTVIASTVREVDSVEVPGVGNVSYWYALTEQGGYCAALKLPDGSWAALGANSRSGVIPGCHPSRESKVKVETGTVGLAPESLDYLSDTIQNPAGQTWELYYGFVTAQGTAAEVRDATTGATAPVTSSGFFLLAERQTYNCDGCDNLQALNAAGQPLPPNYTYGAGPGNPDRH